LLGCSAVAVLTTLGIVLSMVSEAFNFFSFIHPSEFFFGTKWNPAFSSTGTVHGEYGLLPLLWGTLMVSLIAMLVAIPLGLMTAIYIDDFAAAMFRGMAKLVSDIISISPPIVYGTY